MKDTVQAGVYRPLKSVLSDQIKPKADTAEQKSGEATDPQPSRARQTDSRREPEGCERGASINQFRRSDQIKAGAETLRVTRRLGTLVSVPGSRGGWWEGKPIPGAMPYTFSARPPANFHDSLPLLGRQGCRRSQGSDLSPRVEVALWRRRVREAELRHVVRRRPTPQSEVKLRPKCMPKCNFGTSALCNANS